MNAARFGFDVADQAQKQGKILTADQFHALFVAVYADITAPDATSPQDSPGAISPRTVPGAPARGQSRGT
jgi:hypothetical protein